MSTSCRQATESAALRACVAKRRCCCVPVLLSASGACPATTGTECRPRVWQRPKWNEDRLLSTDRSGSVDCRRHGAILAFIRGGAAQQRGMNVYYERAIDTRINSN